VSPKFNQSRLRCAFAEAGFDVQDRDVWIVLAGSLWFPPRRSSR